MPTVEKLGSKICRMGNGKWMLKHFYPLNSTDYSGSGAEALRSYLRVYSDGGQVYSINLDKIPSTVEREYLFAMIVYGRDPNNDRAYVYLGSGGSPDVSIAFQFVTYKHETGTINNAILFGYFDGTNHYYTFTSNKYDYYAEIGSKFWFRIYQMGASVKLKIWKDQTEEPVAWDYEATLPVTPNLTGRIKLWGQYVGGWGACLFAPVVMYRQG